MVPPEPWASLLDMTNTELSLLWNDAEDVYKLQSALAGVPPVVVGHFGIRKG